MATGFQVTFDCADPNRLAHFWATALGYKLQDPPDGFDGWEAWLEHMNIPKENWNDLGAIVDPDGSGPRLLFQKVPEPKTVKNRVHLDVNVGERGTPLEERQARVAAAVDELVAAGATKIEERSQYGDWWVVMQDPEGNEFCLQ